MPIYNGAKYITKSIPAILKQRDVELELILVNDGSKDSSLEVCNDFAAKDARVVVVNQENGGICKARNAGLAAATGEYISFCDQDDEVADNIYKVFDSYIQKYHCDMVIAGKHMFMYNEKDEEVSNQVYSYAEREYRNDLEKNEIILNCDRQIAILHLWNCLYKRSIIQEHALQFDTFFKFGQEDTMFNIQYGLECETIVTAPEVVYKYSRRMNVSTSLKKDAGSLDDYIHFVQELKKAFEHKYQTAYNDLVYLFSLRFAMNIFYRNRVVRDMSAKTLWRDCYEVLRQNRLMKYPKKYRHKGGYYQLMYVLHILSKKKKYGMSTRILNVIK